MIYGDIIDGLMVKENRNYGVNVVMTRRDSRAYFIIVSANVASHVMI